MLVLLGVVGLLVQRARDPATWQWLENHRPAPQSSPARQPERPDVPPGGPVAAGPTDEDPDQHTDAAEEFQAVTDGTIGIQPEEMLAYWRLLLWTEHQSMDMLTRRSRGDVFFTELMQFPENYRGRLVSLDLNVRRVLAYDLDDTPLGRKRLYELWGFSEESKAWLYVAVTAHLPEGMATGSDVYERIRLTGYFFKLQGYYEAGAKPRAAALRAPLLVGRVTRYAPVSIAQASPRNDPWTAVVVGGVVIVLVGIVGWQYVSNRRAVKVESTRREEASQAVRAWLQRK